MILYIKRNVWLPTFLKIWVLVFKRWHNWIFLGWNIPLRWMFVCNFCTAAATKQATITTGLPNSQLVEQMFDWVAEFYTFFFSKRNLTYTCLCILSWDRRKWHTSALNLIHVSVKYVWDPDPVYFFLMWFFRKQLFWAQDHNSYSQCYYIHSKTNFSLSIPLQRLFFFILLCLFPNSHLSVSIFHTVFSLLSLIWMTHVFLNDLSIGNLWSFSKCNNSH